MRTVAWDDEKQALRLIDQRLLPAEFRLAYCYTYQETADAIRQMVVRGAPAIGAAAAFGLALAAYSGDNDDRIPPTMFNPERDVASEPWMSYLMFSGTAAQLLAISSSRLKSATSGADSRALLRLAT